MHYKTETKASQFGVKRSKVKVTVEQSMLGTALSGFVNDILKSISQIFTKLTTMMCYGREMNSLNFGVTRDNICWNCHCTGRGIQYSTSRVELDFLVTV